MGAPGPGTVALAVLLSLATLVGAKGIPLWVQVPSWALGPFHVFIGYIFS